MQSLGMVDVGLAHVVPSGKTAYSAETYVGNWYEQTVRNTLTREEFMKKRECEELSIQKSQIMVDFLLKPVRLTARPNGLVYFGDSIQLVAPGPDCPAAVEAYPFKQLCKFSQLVLSASVPPVLIDYRPFLDTESVISASPHLYPVVRNSFVIERPDCPEDCGDNILHYGDVFRLRAMPTQHFPLYLHSAPATPLHTAAIHSARPQVRFSDTPNPNTLWRAVPLDPLTKMKMEWHGIGVPLKTRMLIQHALSGNNLSVEPNFPVVTYFGDEHEVTVHNKKDRGLRPAWTNHWAFDTERGWRKPDKEIVEQAKFNAAINSNIAAKYASEEAKYPCEEDGDRNKHQDQRDQDQAACAQRAQEAAEQKYEEKCQTLEQYEKDKLSRELARMTLDTEVPGYVLPHDYRTSHQPHAHEYRLSEQQEFYPNKKYDCDGTECCNYRSQPTPADYPYVPPKSDCYEIEPRANCNK